MTLKGVRAGGAILVRPDNMIAWRSVFKSKMKGKELEDAIHRLLLQAEFETDDEEIDDSSRPRL